MSAWTLVIPDWLPARVNQWDGRHWAVRAKLKKADRELVAVYAHQAGIPLATVPRRVVLRLTLAKGQRGGDVDAFWKSTLDALVACGLLVDDNRQSVVLAPVEYQRGPRRRTEIVLEDMIAGCAGKAADSGEKRQGDL